MNLINCAGSFALAFLLVAVNASTTSVTSSSMLSSSSTSLASSTSTLASPTLTGIASLAPPSVAVALPSQNYFINTERPAMINQINSQRNGMKQPLVCQDSLLTSVAQQHANDMAALDTLDHNLPCSSTAFPVQFCSSAKRLAPFGLSAENIVALAGNNGSASIAMAQLNADASQFSNMMNPDFFYVGIGMAMNPVSGKYYWAQVFSSGNYQGVSCTLQPSVTVLDAYNHTTTTVQPSSGLNRAVYPDGITNQQKQGLYCTMIPYAQGKGTSVLPLGQLPYPTITMVPYNATRVFNSQLTGIVGAFAAALSQASATIVGPSSLKMIPMIVSPTSSIDTSSVTMTSFNPASMMATFTPTNSAQSSAQAAMSSMLSDPSMSSLLANPTMSSAAVQMAQYLMMFSSTATPTMSIPTK